MILAICVVVDESKCLDTPIWEFFIICEHLPFLPGYRQILRLLLVHHNPAIWRWYPWSWRLSFVMLMILVQWILHEIQNRFWQYHHGVQLDLYNFGALPPIRHPLNDRCPLVKQNELLRPSSLLHRSPLFILLTLVRSHAGIFSSLSHSLSTAAFAAGIFIAWGIGTIMCTKL